MDSAYSRNDSITKHSRLWMLFIFIAFGLVYARSLVFTYIEGDDATSIAYHLLGRNNELQPAYSPYQGMMDKFLGLLPARENLLHITAMGLTSLAGICMVVLIMALVFDMDKTKDCSPQWRVAASLAVLLAIPELFYFGLAYSPTLIAMCFILSAHLLLRNMNGQLHEGNSRIVRVLFSLILFGLGVSFRWNVIAYGIVIVVDLWINWQVGKDAFSNRFRFGLGWGIAALVSCILMIVASGYGLSDFIDQFRTVLYVTNQIGTLSPGTSASLTEVVVRIALTLSTEFTPAFILFSLIGFINLARTRNLHLWIVLAGLLGVLPWIKSGVPKFIIVSLLVLVFCFIKGFSLCWEYASRLRFKTIYYFIGTFLLIAPWLIGIQVTRTGTAWGPGFQLKQYDYLEPQETSFKFALGAGTAFPTPEGPRSLFGHGFVLLGGSWKELIVGAELERQKNIDTAISMNIPLVVTRWSPDYYLDGLYAMGYTTVDPVNRILEDGVFTERRFHNSSGKLVALLYHEAENDSVFDLAQNLKSISNRYDEVVLIGYSQTMRTLFENFPAALTPLGKTSAIFDLRKLAFHPQVINNYISNPGIGWQYDQHAESSDQLPETVAYIDRSKIAWKILNPAENVYDWSVLDSELSLAIAQGKQISFRVYTMSGESFGGAMVPDWVQEKGAVILPSGEPNYSNCTYQEQWGNFVDALRQRYDGNRAIAFIDVSGYGKFNEWNWDDQTEWDSIWESNFTNGAAVPSTMQSVDAQTRRRLADIFIGGSFKTHSCRDSASHLQTVSYSYTGFKHTQLIMPYAGVVQSLQYVYLRRSDIGFRYDCLGRYSDSLGDQINELWKRAPVAFELCSSDQFDSKVALQTLLSSHGSLIHNNDYQGNTQDLQSMVMRAGYRYYLKETNSDYRIKQNMPLALSMIWQNVGIAPSYPKMGQDFQIHVYLISETDRVIALDIPVQADLSKWMPADSTTDSPPDNKVDLSIPLPENIQPGVYDLMVSIIDQRTGNPIQLAFKGADSMGRYLISSIEVAEK